MPPDVSGGGSGQPATGGFMIIPSDTQDLPFVTRAIWVGGSGDIALVTLGRSVLILSGAVQGSIIAVRATKVFVSNTSATNLVGLY